MMKFIFAGLLSLFYCMNSIAANVETPKGVIALTEKPAPHFRLADLDDNWLDSNNLKGQWAFVHFWASWCTPCREEMPAIARMAEKMRDENLAIVLINTAENEDAIFSFMGIVAPDLNTLIDRDGLATERWQPRGLPATYLVDPEGMLRYQALGGRPWEEPAYIGFLRALTRKSD